jgi:hypothetical protein
MRLSFVAALICLSSQFTYADIPSYINPAHRPTLETFLNAQAGLRVAPEAFCECDADLKWLREAEPGFEPYYAVGDINDDGIDDFAVALVEGTPAIVLPIEVRIVVFHGPFRKGRINRGVTVLKRFSIARSHEVLSVFKTRYEPRAFKNMQSKIENA